MPICGFNQKMIEGLHGLQNGLVEHGIIERSKKKNQTHEETLKKNLMIWLAFKKKCIG